MKVKYLVFSFCCLLLSGSYIRIWGQAPSEPKPSLTAVRIQKPIALTGKLDDPQWALAQSVDLNYEFTPGDNIPPRQKTTVKALYDDKYLYFGFFCYDTNPEQIRANITDRDNIFNDDFVIVIIDTYGDYQRAYELAVNPYGIKGDMMRTGTSENSSFDMIWDAATSKNDKGWTAVIAVPFSSLTFPSKPEQTWALEIARNLPRESPMQIAWTRIDRNIPSILPQSGILKGLNNIQSGGTVELLPYMMGQKSGYLSDAGNPGSGIKYNDIVGRLGGGIKYSPSTNFSVDAVINPDFSQIESDAAQISVNTTFALNYDEKRPYFLTGKELFSDNMYYSRSINNPLYAARVIGKSGGLTYMFMDAYDRNTVLVIPGEDQSNTVATSIESYANIGRLRYDFGNEIYIGAELFTRNMSGGHNYVLGMDWKYKFLQNWYFNGAVYLSQTKEVNDTTLFNNMRTFSNTNHTAAFDGEEYSGTGTSISLTHNESSYSFSLAYNDYSPTYQTYDGLWTGNNLRQFIMGHSFIFYPANSFINKASFSLSGSIRYNYTGINKERFVNTSVSLQMKGETSLSFSYYVVNDENFFNTELNGVHRAVLNFSTAPMNEISFSFSGQYGNFIHRSTDPSVGWGHNVSMSLTLKPTSKFNLSLSYSRSRLRDNETEDLFFDGNIYRAVAIYQFIPEMLFRTIFQYNTFSNSFQVYPLFSYKLNAFTTFFAGVTSNYVNYRNDYGIINTDQQYFIKVQYLVGI